MLVGMCKECTAPQCRALADRRGEGRAAWRRHELVARRGELLGGARRRRELFGGAGQLGQRVHSRARCGDDVAGSVTAVTRGVLLLLAVSTLS